MAVLTFPSIIPSSVSFGIKYNTQINVSTLSGSVQTIEVPGARWVASLSFDDLEPAEGRVLAAFLAQLRGSSGRFTLYDHSHKTPRGSNLGTTVIVDADAQVQVFYTSTALGTHSTLTLADTTQTFITDGLIAIGDLIRNIDNDEIRAISSFTETVITVSPLWTQPINAENYEIYSVEGQAKILESGTALGTHSTTTLQDTTQTFTTDGLITIGDLIRNVNNNETRIIDSFTIDTITTTTTWTLPVDTDIYEIYPLSQTGNTIATSGWTVSELNLLLPGDYIEFPNNELKIVTTAVSSDTNGEAIITFDPPIRIAPTDLSIINRTNCEAVMLLDKDENRWNTNNAGLLTNFTIGCAEGF